MITDIQRHQLAILDRAKVMCEAEGTVAKIVGYGTLLLVLPVYGDAGAEQLMLDATAPAAQLPAPT